MFEWNKQYYVKWNINLTVIRTAMQWDPMFPQNKENKGSKCKEKKRGPKIKPCGTPLWKGTEEDIKYRDTKTCVKPVYCCIFDTHPTLYTWTNYVVLHSIKSNNMRITKLPESFSKGILLKTLRADSVLDQILEPDSRISVLSKK